MKEAKIVKAEDRADYAVADGDGQRLDPNAMLGTWFNTNAATRGINKVVLAARDDKLMMHAFATGDASPADWGEAEAESLYANTMTSRVAIALIAHFTLETMEVDIQANLNQGLLVIGSFSTFLDRSRRSNYFSREFFHQ